MHGRTYNNAGATRRYRFDGSYPMDAAIVPLLWLLGDKLEPSTIDKQPKYLWFLFFIEGQPHLV